MTDSTQYKYVTQDSDGWIKGWNKHPGELYAGGWLGNWEMIMEGDDSKSYMPLLVDLSTHDYEIVEDKLIALDKEQIFKGSEMQYQDNSGDWHKCMAKAYRIKPKTKIIRYRTYITVDGEINVTHSEAIEKLKVFKEWIDDTWKEHVVTL